MTNRNRKLAPFMFNEYMKSNGNGCKESEINHKVEDIISIAVQDLSAKESTVQKTCELLVIRMILSIIYIVSYVINSLIPDDWSKPWNVVEMTNVSKCTLHFYEYMHEEQWPIITTIHKESL